MESIKEIYDNSMAIREAIGGQPSLFGSLSCLTNLNQVELYNLLPTAFHYSIIESVSDRFFFESVSNQQLITWLADWVSIKSLIPVSTKGCYAKPDSEFKEWQLLELADFECLRDLPATFTCEEMSDWLYDHKDYDASREVARRKMHFLETINAVTIVKSRSIGENQHMQATINKELIKYIETV